MASFTFGLGKGLREPVSPFRSDYIFGAELGDFDASNWNDIPTIWDPTTSFNLAALTPGHEVVVSLFAIDSAPAGVYDVTLSWRRVRDEALLYRFSYSGVVPAGGWMYAYSYIGYVPWEINENGRYRAEVVLWGPATYQRQIYFDVLGIPTVPVPEPVPGEFVDSIFSKVWDIGDAVYAAYSEVKGWIWPFYLLQSPLYALYVAFRNLLTPIANFGEWVYDVADKIADILSLGDIGKAFKDIFDAAVNAWSWVVNAFTNVTSIINTWWSPVSLIVQIWIAVAKQAVTDLIDSVKVSLVTLQMAWDNFKGRIPTIDTIIAWWGNLTANILLIVNNWWKDRLLDIQGLINSAFVVREGLWAGWQELRDQVLEFLSNPLEFLLTRFTDWFLGPEE